MMRHTLEARRAENRTEQNLIREPLPLVGNETDSSVESGDLVLCLRGISQLLGGASKL